MPSEKDPENSRKQMPCSYCRWLVALAAVLILLLLAMLAMWFFRPAKMLGGSTRGGSVCGWKGARGGCGCMAPGAF